MNNTHKLEHYDKYKLLKDEQSVLVKKVKQEVRTASTTDFEMKWFTTHLRAEISDLERIYKQINDLMTELDKAIKRDEEENA